MPKVSVIIPTYNHQEFVLSTIESVWSQTYADYELIVVNDGSPDQTSHLLRPLAEAQRVIYIEKPNGGQASARNCGLAVSRGEYIAFLDDDDLWPTDKLQWQVDYLNAHPEVGLIGGTNVFLKTTMPELKPGTCSICALEFEGLFGGSPFHSPGQTLIRASVLKKVKGFNTGIWGADDVDLYMRLARECRLEKCDQPSLLYRIHAKNASSDWTRMLTNARKVIRQNLSFVPPQRRDQIQALAWRWMYSYIGRRVVRAMKADLRECRIKDVARRMQIMCLFIARSALQPELAQMMFHDWTPVRWKHPRL